MSRFSDFTMSRIPVPIFTDWADALGYRFSLGGGKITKHLAFPNKLNVTRFMTRPPAQGQVRGGGGAGEDSGNPNPNSPFLEIH